MPALVHSAPIPHRDVPFPILIRAIFAGLGTFACAACGGSREASREAEGGDGVAVISACDLLTREEITDILQSPVGEPQEQVISKPAADRAGISQCTHTAADAVNKSVSLFLRQSPARDNDPAAVRATLVSAGTSVSDVTGVGDAAFWDGAKLHIFAGGHIYLTIGVSGTSAAQEQAKALALAALGRIGAAPTSR